MSQINNTKHSEEGIGVQMSYSNKPASPEDLLHYGVKGMKWGVRKDKGHEGESAKLSKIAKLDKQFAKRKVGREIYNATTRHMNSVVLPKINNDPRYKNADLTDGKNDALKRRYDQEVRKAFESSLQKEADKLGTNASGTKRYKVTPSKSSDEEFWAVSWSVDVVDVKHSDSTVEEVVRPVRGPNGHILQIEPVEEEMMQTDTVSEFLEHYGVKGMKWGVRKDRPEGVTRSTNRAAMKDAREFARAKMFYGEGAGTRRKLIKAKVESMSKRDPSYKKAFDHHLAKQDMAVHASKARRERKRKNVASSTAKTTRGISHYLRGNPQYASAAAAMIAGGALWAHKNGVDKAILKAGKTTLKSLKKSNIRPGMKASDFLKNL